MLYNWTIRNKLYFVLALLVVVVGTLSWNAIHGLYAYRCIVRSLYRRVPELPLANDFSKAAGELRLLWYAERKEASTLPNKTEPFAAQARDERAAMLARGLTRKVAASRDVFEKYQARIHDGLTYDFGLPMNDSRQEQESTYAILKTMAEIERLNDLERWHFDPDIALRMTAEVDRLQMLASRLPTFLHENIEESVEDARVQYRTLIFFAWITSATTVLFTAWLIYLFYRWIFRPLRKLISGSRRIATGYFSYRIRLETHDEMSELARNLNAMTNRFLEINNKLDEEVAERTQQVIRGEQLASVGFLAAGVAHEINNPLASIAVCAESLHERVTPLLNADDPDHKIIDTYLGMIEKEAFRCKGITEKLLDFSRIGDSQRSTTDIRALIQDVVEMVRHVGQYHAKRIEFAAGLPVYAVVDGREIKQVVLNLVTNALDSLDDDGRVKIEIGTRPGEVEIVFTDNGCGMTEEVRTHLFEPFFTRRRSGQGTGLGLSISYRIVADHQGTILAHSEGPGTGSQFRLRLPTAPTMKEQSHRHKAA
ncbi:MAG: HAMP domain-containing histidine kinase [Planctomycetia bacterium]|nr:HAMP domain-containing histidine kinase [Planctomycetia bacterium]